MKLAGHTMGTPKLNLNESIQLCAELHLDGIEIRCAADGHLNVEKAPSMYLKEIKTFAEDNHVAIACLTPYYRDYYTPGKRQAEIDGMRRTIDAAQQLGCRLVRAYGGITPPAGTTADTVWNCTVEGLREIANHAATAGVTICVENHSGTLTHKAIDTLRLVNAVDCSNIGILFDYAWCTTANPPEPPAVVDTIAKRIVHIHAKDWRFEPDGTTTTTLMGQGAVPWPEVIERLVAAGYDGYVSLEYEKYWKAYLPEPEIGMKADAEYVRTLWDQTESARKSA